MTARQTAPPTGPEINALIAPHLDREGPLLPILHDIQAAFGKIPEAAHAPIVEALNISRAELHGVISFYHDFRTVEAGAHVIRICRSEACQAMGGVEMAAKVLAHFGLDWGGTTPDGAVTVEPVYCLGLCACAPAAMVGERLIGRAHSETVIAAVPV